MGRLGVGCELRMARSWNSFEIEGEPALCPLYVGACGFLREKISLYLTLNCDMLVVILSNIINTVLFIVVTESDWSSTHSQISYWTKNAQSS